MQAKWLLLILSVSFASLTVAQKSREAPAGKRPTSASVPTFKLTFVQKTDAPRLAASQVIYGPMGCSPDGAAFLETASPSDLQKNALSSLAVSHDSYSAVNYSLDTISDLHDARLRSYFAAESEVLVLANATRDDALSTSKRTLVVPSTGESFERNIKSGRRHDYLVTFDRRGNYKSAVELDVPFKVSKVAVFASGQFLVIGSDSEHKTIVAFVSADGSLQRFLDAEKPLLGSEKMMEAVGVLKKQSPAVQANPHPILGLAQIVPFQDKLLFALSGMRWILEITPGGAIRRVPIRLPPGLVIDHFIPSQEMWYIALRTYGAESNQDQESAFYEVSPFNGTITKRLETTPEYVSEIACEHDGEFRALLYDVNGQILLIGKP